MRARRWLCMLLVLGGWTGGAAQAWGQGKPPPVRKRTYSPYERRVIDRVLSERGVAVDLAPEGKQIEAIEVVPLDVIDDYDPAPPWLNRLHATSRGYVIDREMLLRPGDRWRQVLIDESSRNLRALPQLSLVACVPVLTGATDRVRLLVITKDVWSLRAGADLAFTNGGLEKLTLVPAETNVAGLHHSASLRYEQLPESFQLGARYAIPRVWGSRLYGALEWNVIFNRRSGDPEGNYGLVSVGRPLFSSITPWGFAVSGAFRQDITRRYVNAELGTFDAESTPQNDRIPFAYRSSTHAANAVVTRSYGWGIKHDFSFGGEVSYRAFALPELGGYDPRAVDEFKRTKVPNTDHRVGPLVQYHTYTSDFITILDYDTLGLQEDVRVGHNFGAKVYPVLRQLGASRDYVGLQVSASYTAPLADGFARVAVNSTNETTGRHLSDGLLGVAGTIVTPRLGFGRVIFSASTTQRYRNYRNETSYLGGDTTLRGYPSSLFVGKDVIVYNLEFRSRPVEILTAQLGIALFHDVGDAYDGPGDLRLRRAVGLGLRALFPQLNRLVLRADLGVPLTLDDVPAGVPPISFFIAFDQAFRINP